MRKVSTNITIDPILKEESMSLLSQLGLDLSTAVTIFLTQTVREKRIPFEIRLEVPNKDTIEALSEIEEMKTNKKKYKRYSSFEEVLKEIDWCLKIIISNKFQKQKQHNAVFYNNLNLSPLVCLLFPFKTSLIEWVSIPVSSLAFFIDG